MGWLSFLRDFRTAIDASTPHGIKASELNRSALELIAEARDENADLTDRERELRREEARRLMDEVRSLGPAIEQPWDDLAARHPGKITK